MNLSTFTNRSINPLIPFLGLITIGVLGMWFGEIWPDTFFWAPALCMGIMRAYIVIMGPSIQGSDDLSPEYRKAQYWSWTSLVLFAIYLAIMYWQDPTNSMHIALQCVNIMLMGAEYTFGQWQANRQQNVDQQIEFDELNSSIVSLQNEIVEKNQQIVDQQNRLNAQMSANKSLRRYHDIMRMESEEPVRVSQTHQAIRCPECLELVTFGNATKEVSHCGEVIYSQINGQKVEPQLS